MPNAWRTCMVWFPMSSDTVGAQVARRERVARVCVRRCVSVAYAHPTSLQMSSGRAKCPLDDMLPVQVCLQTHLASIVRSNGPESGTASHAGKHRGFVCGNCFPNLALNQSKPTRRSQIIFLLQWGDQVIYRINLFFKREGKLEAIMRTLGWHEHK